MVRMRRLNVDINEELYKALKREVERGSYRTISEVIRDMLRKRYSRRSRKRA